MKILYRNILVFLLIGFSVILNAQITLSISGNLMDENQLPVSNHTVTVEVYNSDSLYYNTDSIQSDSIGSYSFNLEMQNISSGYFVLQTLSCGDLLTAIYNFSFSQTVFIHDFLICVDPCIASFTYQEEFQNKFVFQANSSPMADFYEWDFGDGIEATGATVEHYFDGSSATSMVHLKAIIVDPAIGDTCIATYEEELELASADWIVHFYGYVKDSNLFPVADYQVDLKLIDWNNPWWETFSTTTNEEGYYSFEIPTIPIHNEGDYVVSVLNCGDTLELTGSYYSYDPNIENDFYLCNQQACENSFTYISLGENVFDFTGFASPEAISYQWDFGDGEIAYGQSVQHSYVENAVDTMTVVLTTLTFGMQNDSCVATSSQLIILTDEALQASFSYQYDSISPLPYSYYFGDSSIGTPDSWLWDFGDGESSSIPSPSHSYTQFGTYSVCLTISRTINGQLEQDTFCETITTPSYYTIGGTAYLDLFPMNNPEHQGDTGVAYQYRKYQGEYVAMDTMRFTQYGFYYFTEVLEGDILVKLDLTESSTHYQEYLPTYFGDSPFWQDNNAYFLSDSGTYYLDVVLSKISQTAGGSGFASGQLYISENCTGNYELSNTTVFLENEEGQIVDFTKSNDEGYFEFTNISIGNYALSADRMNLFSEKTQFSITSTTTQVANLNLVLSCSEPNIIINSSSLTFEMSDVFPNPVCDHLSFTIVSFGRTNVDVKIYSVLGTLVYQQKENLLIGNNKLDLDTRGLSSGSYIMQVISSNEEWSGYQKFVK